MKKAVTVKEICDRQKRKIKKQAKLKYSVVKITTLSIKESLMININ